MVLFTDDISLLSFSFNPKSKRIFLFTNFGGGNKFIGLSVADIFIVALSSIDSFCFINRLILFFTDFTSLSLFKEFVSSDLLEELVDFFFVYDGWRSWFDFIVFELIFLLLIFALPFN